MPEIVFLHESPESANFCSEYIADCWNLQREESVRMVEPCLAGHSLPFILVAKEENFPIGMVLASAENADVSTKYSPWLLALYVKEEFRKRGIGKTLVDLACGELKKLGHSVVYIDTVDAENFYRRMSWKFIEEVPWRDEITKIFSKNLVEDEKR